MSELKFYKALLRALPDREYGAHAPVCELSSRRGGRVFHAEEVVVDVRLLRGDVVAPRGQLPAERGGVGRGLPVLDAALRLAQLLRVHGVHSVLAGRGTEKSSVDKIKVA